MSKKFKRVAFQKPKLKAQYNSLDHAKLVFRVVKQESDDEDDDEEDDEEEEPMETVVNVNGVIGDSFEGLDANAFVSQIQQINGPIRMRINTPGGLVFDALDANEALASHPHKVTADIVGQSWSAGTILTAAADEVRIMPAAKFGVHRAWSGFLLLGNEEELREQMNQLESDIESLQKLDVDIAKMLADRSGMKFKEVHDFMVGKPGVDGTEFTGQEAVDVGFADALIENKKRPAGGNNRAFRDRQRTRAIEIALRRQQWKLTGTAS